MLLMVMLLAEDMLLTLSELSTLLREKLMLSLRLMLMPFMVSTHMVTTTLDSHLTLGQLSPAMPDLLFLDQLFPAIPDQLSLATLGQLSPAMPDQLFQDQLFPAIQDQSFLATPDQLFLDTPASTESVVCGKMFSHRTANRSSIAIQFKICCFYLNKLFHFLFKQ